MAASTATAPAGPAATTIPLIINGKSVISDRVFEIRSPATGNWIYSCSNVSESQVQMVVEVAAQAFQQWRRTSPVQRRDIFLRAADIMGQRKEELAEYMMLETGASRQWADLNVDTAKDFLIDTAGRVGTIEGCIPRTQTTETHALVLKEPYGVVLGIAPW
jgi:acyl-CoA reductase-like NAD-dependent aldehyde dehydrogenase